MRHIAGMRLRRVIGAVYLTASLVSAQGAQPDADPTRYAALSMLGDHLSVVTATQQTGSSIDARAGATATLDNDSLDRLILLATQQALRDAAGAATPVTLLAGADVPLGQSDVDSAPSAETLRRLLGGEVARLSDEGVTRLILVRPYRAPAVIRFPDGRSTGHGSLEGIGFYIDTSAGWRTPGQFNTHRGCVAAFAYLQASLWSLPELRLLGEQTAAMSELYDDDPNGLDTGATLAPRQREPVLFEVVTRAAEFTLTRLLASHNG